MATEIGEYSGEIINRSGYGGSIPVDNVQALASEELKDIPIRYVRPEIESEEVLIDDSLQVPVIDFSKLSVAGKPGYDDEMAKLHVARRDWGFFQVISTISLSLSVYIYIYIYIYIFRGCLGVLI